MRILEPLGEAAPRTVTKASLLEQVWPDCVVTEAAPTQRIKELRKLVGDYPHTPWFIETLARRGYRLVAPVPPLPETDEAPESLPPLAVLVADVDAGGEPEAAAFKRLLQRRLAESGRCGVASDERMRVSLALADLPSASPLDERIALRVARRDADEVLAR